MKALLPVACSFLLTAYGVNAFAQGGGGAGTARPIRRSGLACRGDDMSGLLTAEGQRSPVWACRRGGHHGSIRNPGCHRSFPSRQGHPRTNRRALCGYPLHRDPGRADRQRCPHQARDRARLGITRGSETHRPDGRTDSGTSHPAGRASVLTLESTRVRTRPPQGVPTRRYKKEGG
jgi:hypothetical protein